MEDVRGLRKVIADTSPSMNHFLFSVKLRGFDGSSCESHPMRPFSSSVTGYTSRSSFCFLVLFLERCFSRSLPMSSWICSGSCKLISVVARGCYCVGIPVQLLLLCPPRVRSRPSQYLYYQFLSFPSREPPCRLRTTSLPDFWFGLCLRLLYGVVCPN